MSLDDVAKNIAQELLRINAFVVRPDSFFTWASGIRSPLYCDNRLTLSFPKVRNIIIDGFCELIRVKYSNVDNIAGVATAGIPHGALVAFKLGLPFFYVRSSNKGHGKQNKVEGIVKKGDQVVVVEDLISSGGSSINAVKSIRECGANVLGVVSIFSYGLEVAKRNFKENNIDFSPLTTLETLLGMAVSLHYIKDTEIEKIYKWRESL